MSLSDNPSPMPAAAAETSYVDWPAIFAGAALSLAISFVLLTFGSALGLSFGDNPRQDFGFGFVLAAGLWLLWVQSSACIAGGYLSGRLRRRKHDATEDESDVRDGSHGLVVWAIGVLVGGTLLVSGISGAVSTAATAVGSVAGSAASGTASLAGSAVGNPDFSLLIDRYLRGDGKPDSAPSADTRAEVSRVLGTLADGDVSQADRQYLAQSLATRTGIDQPTAQARVNDLISGAQQVKQAAKDAANKARKAALVAAFAAAASLFIAAVGAYYGATLGGKHRDEGTFGQEWVPNFIRSRRW